MAGQSSRESGGTCCSGATFIDAVNVDLLHIILSRLPARSFASAACVNRSWKSICSRILSSPKFSSAFSLNRSMKKAVDEVFEKVLSVPIRPQFAIVHAAAIFYPQVHQLVAKRLGSEIPIITSVTEGIIGCDALTDKFKEIIWEDEEPVQNHGILLTVGYFPGVKSNLIPLSFQDEEHEDLLIDGFVQDIRQYTSSVSGSASPSAIILFADLKTDMKPVLQKMDYAFPYETVIVGEAGGRCLYRSNWKRCTRRQQNSIVPAIALVFAKDRNKSPGIGEIQFHAALSTGTTPVGPKYKAASVKERYSENCTWLTARREGVRENLDGQTILENINNEMGEMNVGPNLYVGVRKRRKCSIGREKVRWKTFLEFHQLFGGDEEYLFVNDVGIRTGDSFQLYATDSNLARSTSNNVSEAFKLLKDDFEKKHQANNAKESVFGGLIFACCGRGESFFGHAKIDSQPFLDNFPGVTIAGSFCNGELKRGHSIGYGEEDPRDLPCSVHAFSTVYLVLSYISAEN